MLAFIMKKRVQLFLYWKKTIWNFAIKTTDLKNQLTTMIYDKSYLIFRHL